MVEVDRAHNNKQYPGELRVIFLDNRKLELESVKLKVNQQEYYCISIVL